MRMPRLVERDVSWNHVTLVGRGWLDCALYLGVLSLLISLDVHLLVLIDILVLSYI